ncbi:MAG: hypothetical protein VXX04_01850 [Actinomycetota bacterium]|nr:hypothetical protein [Actinomycetota bacterium]
MDPYRYMDQDEAAAAEMGVPPHVSALYSLMSLFVAAVAWGTWLTLWAFLTPLAVFGCGVCALSEGGEEGAAMMGTWVRRGMWPRHIKLHLPQE